MQLKEMFLKDIERNISGVIKVAQTNDREIYQELDEYVVTQELHKHFSKFYENYQKGIDGKTDKMGVWISGFFGSGKSHFLKILAYLLKNEEVLGRRPVDFFEEKVQDPIVYANMQRTANVETEVILFNIDSKSPLNNKSKDDAILRVFLKVFYEHLGYYGDILGLAEMEKQLDEMGAYDTFKEEFLAQAGEPWKDRRHAFHFDEDYIVQALVKATTMSEQAARNWHTNGVNNVEISIEKFAKDVKSYIKSKGPNFHLVFLVDEIGQYIGDNRNLMLNLQTVTEDLGTHAEGKVWVMVTSQESIDTIVKVKGDDFSRIQGRFDTRLSLSSISVDEVIKKRILDKKSHVFDKLRVVHQEKSAILKNVISFRDSTADLRGYDNDIEFAEVYPFVPYQFKLLQNVFEQIRKHGSSGKHLSEGERSMISAYKESALQYKNAEEGVLVPFHAFYETIREFLGSPITRVIEGAAVNPALKDDPFNLELLKVLFMIKYIKELPANIDNLATLMITHIDQDKLQLKEKINLSLRKLIKETLIQKNGEQYIFLTDDEQDVNREINQMAVEEDAVKKEIADYIFNDLYSGKQFVYSNRYSFAYNQKIDDRNYGNQTAAVGIQVFTPLADDYHKSDQELMMLSSNVHEMFIKLGGSELYIEEVEDALRIESYLRKINRSQMPENIQNILNNKQSEARARRDRAKQLLEEALKDAGYFVYGEKIEVKGSTVKERINMAFKQLIDNVYTKLGYVKEYIDSGKELVAYLNADDKQVTFDSQMKINANELAEHDVFEFINLQEQIGKQVRVKVLYDRFQDKPYGWKQIDIAYVIAALLKTQKIRIRYNTQYMEPATHTNELLTIFDKTAEADKGIITKRTKVDDSLIRTAKRISKDIFNRTDLADDEDGLLHNIRQLIEDQIKDIEKYKAKYEGINYPGLSLLNKGLEYFNQFSGPLDNATYFNKLKELEDDLADWDNDVAYVKSFLDTSQKEIFKQGLDGLDAFDENQTYLTGEAIENAADQLHAIIKNPVPYGEIKKIPELVHTINENIQNVLTKKKASALQKIQADYEELIQHSKQYGVSDGTKQKIEMYYENAKNRLAQLTNIFKVDAAVANSTEFTSDHIIIINREIEKSQEERANNDSKTGLSGTVTIEKQTEKVKVTELVPTSTFETEEDVDRYVNVLANKLKNIIKANKKIEFID